MRRGLSALLLFGVAQSLTPVPALNATAYLGVWYQMFQDLATSLIESNYCVVAEYGLNPNGTVSVHNQERQVNVTGPATGIYGYAVQDNPTTSPGELTVYLQGPPVGAPYWIFGLGPINHGLYDWALVSDPLQLSLFVLGRNVTEFYANYNQTLYEKLLGMGFNNFINSPTPTNQDGCTYY